MNLSVTGGVSSDTDLVKLEKLGIEACYSFAFTALDSNYLAKMPNDELVRDRRNPY